MVRVGGARNFPGKPVRTGCPGRELKPKQAETKRRSFGRLCQSFFSSSRVRTKTQLPPCAPARPIQWRTG
jgi:hypothetical protein